MRPVIITRPQAAIIELMRRDEYATISYGREKNFCPVSATDPAERTYCKAMTIDSMRKHGYVIEIKPGVFRRNMECIWFKEPTRRLPVEAFRPYVKPKKKNAQ